MTRDEAMAAYRGKAAARGRAVGGVVPALDVEDVDDCDGVTCGCPRPGADDD